MNIKPKYEVGTKFYFTDDKDCIYKIADHVYYKSVNTWYYWLRGIEQKSIRGKTEWVYTHNAKQLTIESIDNKSKNIIVI